MNEEDPHGTQLRLGFRGGLSSFWRAPAIEGQRRRRDERYSAPVKIIPAVVAALIVATVAGCSSPSAPASPTPTATAAASVTVPDLSGGDGSDARDKLKNAGLEVDFDAGSDTVILASNWTVTGQDPAAGTSVPAGSTVTVDVERKAAPTSDATSAAPAAPADATTTGLQGPFALTACDEYGKAAYPYGWKSHTILGLIASQAEGDHWFAKFDADVTNAFGAQRSVTVECAVSGTNDAPNVTAFNTY